MMENQDPPRGGRDDVEALMRLAGKRPEVPSEVMGRVRAAAEAQWRREVARRKRGRRVWVAAGLAAAACFVAAVVWWLPSAGGSGRQRPRAQMRVERVEGAAWSRPAGSARVGQPLVLTPGLAVSRGVVIETEAESAAALRHPAGHSLRLDAASEIRWLADGTLELTRGAVYLDSSAAGAAAPLEIRSPLGTAREIGTQFEVRLESGSVVVRVREGAVLLRGEVAEHVVRAGSELEVDRDGTTRRRALAPHAPQWAWVMEIAPVLDLEGRTAAEFLHWAAREGGWTLSFQDTRVERAASEIVLGGTIEGLTPRQALDAVLPTCRMIHRIDEGVLWIDAEG